MSTINPNAPLTPGRPDREDAPPTDADEGAVQDFEKALQNPAPPRSGSLFDNFTVNPSGAKSLFEDFTVTPKKVDPKSPDAPNTDEVIDLNNYEPEKPVVPTPEEPKSDFWSKVWGGIKKGGDDVAKFIASPEFAKFTRAANIVFAGAMVVAAGVLAATGVGAPAAVAAIALAGAAGLAMQLPAVHDKLQAGVVAFMAPILGQENAEKLGPLVTQGLISGLMIAIIVSGGSAADAKGALDAAVGVFNTMKDVFNGIAQLYQSGGPVFELLGIEVDAKAIQDMSAMFGSMALMLPDLSTFSEGIGMSLKDFLANPDMDAFKKFLGTVKEVPESISKLIDSDFLKGLGSLLDGAETFLADFKSTDLLNNITGLLQLLDQGAKLAKA